MKTQTALRKAHRTLAAATIAMLCLAPTLAYGQAPAPAQQLAQTMSKLVPYSVDGGTIQALGELRQLTTSLDPQVAGTARFLSAAASVELLAYSNLSGDTALPGTIASAMGLTESTLVPLLDNELASSAQGAFRPEAESLRVVLSCVTGIGWERCETDLRRIAESGTAGATSARVLLLSRAVQAIEQARQQPPEQAIAPLVAAAGTLCANPQDPALVQACGTQDQGAIGPRITIAEAMISQTMTDVTTLRTAGAAGDPLVQLASHWIDSVEVRMGWNALVRPFEPSTLSDARLPQAASAAGLPPLGLMVIGQTKVTVGMSPVTILRNDGAVRLDEQAGYPLPGKAVFSFPGNFRPAIQPIAPVTKALTAMRTRITEVTDGLGAGGPGWVASERDVLGLVIDEGVIVADLARFVLSARRAGYQRFAIFGLRQDGRLVAIPTEIGSVAAGPPTRTIPRVRIGPRDVTLTHQSIAPAQFHRRTELQRLGTATATHLGVNAAAFAVQGGPMMPYGMVFPSIDAVVAAGQTNDPECLFLLPP